MINVTITTENVVNGQVNTITGYRVRNSRQLEALRRRLAKVYATHNERIVTIK